MMIIISSNILVKIFDFKVYLFDAIYWNEMMQSRNDAIWSKTSSTPD